MDMGSTKKEWQCPYCEQVYFIKDFAFPDMCPECDDRLKKREKAKEIAAEKRRIESKKVIVTQGQRPSKTPVLIVGISVAIVFLLMVVINRPRQPAPQKFVETPPAIPSPRPATPDYEKRSVEVPAVSQSNPSLRSGDVGRIDGNGPVLLTTDEAAYDKLLRSLRVKDTRGVLELILEQRAFEVEDGAQVLIVKSGWSLHFVRVQNGKAYGRAGFVAVELVSPN